MNRMACSLFKRREGFQEIERSLVRLDMVNEGLSRNIETGFPEPRRLVRASMK
jgi:hypothetical protein